MFNRKSLPAFLFSTLMLFGATVPMYGALIMLADGTDYSDDAAPLPKLDSGVDTIDYVGGGVLCGAKFGSCIPVNAAILSCFDFTTTATNTITNMTWTADSFMENVTADGIILKDLTLDGNCGAGAFRSASLVGADFSGTTLDTGSEAFRYADLTNADFSGITFCARNSTFRQAIMLNADFSMVWIPY